MNDMFMYVHVHDDDYMLHVKLCRVYVLSYCVTCCPGSSNGYVALWKCGSDFRSLDCCFTVALVRGELLS